MINPTGKKLEKLLFGMFDDAIQGVDTYNHNGSMWLIFTDEMRWVVEYTKEQTLWYNYHLFKQEMEIIGLDCVENKDLIQKWFESRFLNINPVEDTIQNGVKHIKKSNSPKAFSIDNTIQNGVKHTKSNVHPYPKEVRDTIQNGVKQTELSKRDFFPEDIIQNGVKHTKHAPNHHYMMIEDTIKNGVKHCEDGDRLDGDYRFEDIIQNGVKQILDDDIVDYKTIENITQNGAK